MTRGRIHTIAIIALAGLVFVGAGCSSSDNDATPADRSDTTSAPSDRAGRPPSTAMSDLPEGWPVGVTLPEGTELGVHKVVERFGERVLKVSGTISGGDRDEISDWIEANLRDAGYTIETPGDGRIPGSNVRAIIGGTNVQTVTITVTEMGDDVLVTYSVEPRH